MFVREPPSISPEVSAEERLVALESEVAEIRRQLGIFQASLIELYQSVGLNYPYGEAESGEARKVG
jgi:hypothetical protein